MIMNHEHWALFLNDTIYVLNVVALWAVCVLANPKIAERQVHTAGQVQLPLFNLFCSVLSVNKQIKSMLFCVVLVFQGVPY